MRRSLAILLLLLFGIPLAGPLLFAMPEANLPACCRAHGAHHCSMHLLPSSSEGLHPPSLEQSCPYRNIKSGFHTTSIFTLEAAPASGLHHPLSISPIEQALAGHRIASARNHHKRGPPSLLS